MQNVRFKKAPRSPFVVTVALAATAMGCGGSTSGGEGTGGSSGAGGGISNPPPIKCPESAPTDGATCDVGIGSCNYSVGTLCNPKKATATCPDGTWLVDLTPPYSTGCNPPPPPDTCPYVEPTLGEWCNLVSDKTCTYPDVCCPPSYSCVNGVWTDVSPSCNPPPPKPCPADKPTAGTPCPAGPCDAAMSCTYGSCGSDAEPYSVMTCSSGYWSESLVGCFGADGGGAP
jgi:hypothetical protein